MDEKALLKMLIKKLGSGIAKFKVQIATYGIRIDLVFEKKNEVWLINAKKKLSYIAVGQILAHKEIYQMRLSPQKELKLGIVCNQGHLAPERICRDKDIEVFIFPKKN